MRSARRSQTGAFGSRFQFGRSFGGACVAVAAFLLTAAVSFGGEYKDPAGTFTIAHDDTIWTIKSGDDGDFAIACVREACDAVAVGCSGSRIWVPLASVGRLTREFDQKGTEQAVIEGLAKEKAEREKGKTPGAENVPPAVVKPYTLGYTRTGHPIYGSDYRVSFDGPVTRFLSFSTGARSHSIAIVCHVPEDRLAVWRPRIDALIEGFRPAPEPFWLRWLAAIGL